MYVGDAAECFSGLCVSVTLIWSFSDLLFLLRQEIGELEKDLATKRALVAKNTAMFTAAEEKFKTLKDEQLRAIYNPKV